MFQLGVNRSALQVLARGFNVPATNLDVRTRNVQSIKDKHADQPAKTGDNLTYPGFASFKRSWLETTHFQKCTFMKEILCSVIERIVKLNC